MRAALTMPLTPTRFAPYIIWVVSCDAICSFWKRNFMLDVSKPTLAAYVDTFKGNKNFKQERQQLHRECIDAYQGFVAQDAEDASE